jgi:putative nucleotidyltransferase with HDIG domain
MKLPIRLYVAAIVVAASAVLVVADWTVAPGDSAHWNALAAFLVLGFLTEASYLKLRVGRGSTQSSVAFIPFIASVLLFSPGWAALVASGSTLAVEVAVRRKSPIRVLFNVGQMVLSIGLAAFVFAALGGVPSVEHFHFQPTATAAGIVTYFFVNSTAVSAAVAFSEGLPLGDAWLRIAGASLVYDIVSSPLGALLAFLYSEWQLWGILLLVLPLLFVRHIYRVALQLEQVNRDLLELMVKAIEARDPYTSGHSQRVSHLAEILARAVGLGAKHVEQIKTAALLHDVGKIHEEYAPLLRKEGRLDSTEQALMQTHSMRSAELVGTISAFRGPVLEAVRHHHENFDGSGYPQGLAGAAIPIGARIIMIADTVDAMTTDRPYRKALAYERVVQELDRFAGKQFDPRLVEAFVKSEGIRAFMGIKIEASAQPSFVPVIPPITWRQTPSRQRSRSASV